MKISFSILFRRPQLAAVAVSLGLFAAWRAATGDLQEALTSGSRSFTGSGASQRFRGFVVIGEISTTLVILIGAGLLELASMESLSEDEIAALLADKLEVLSSSTNY